MAHEEGTNPRRPVKLAGAERQGCRAKLLEVNGDLANRLYRICMERHAASAHNCAARRTGCNVPVSLFANMMLTSRVLAQQAR